MAPEQWSNVIDTFEYGSKCAQMSFFIPDLYEGEEDCLYLNVYVPGEHILINCEIALIKSKMI